MVLFAMIVLLYETMIISSSMMIQQFEYPVRYIGLGQQYLPSKHILVMDNKSSLQWQADLILDWFLACADEYYSSRDSIYCEYIF